MRISIAIAAVLLFCTGFWICELVYPNDLVAWTHLRMNLYSVLIFLAFVSCRMGTNTKLVNTIFDVGIGVSVSDIIDRVYFDVTKFQWSDLVMLSITIILAIFDNYVRTARNS